MLMADHIKAHNLRRQIEFLKQEKAMLVEFSKKLAWKNGTYKTSKSHQRNQIFCTSLTMNSRKKRKRRRRQPEKWMTRKGKTHSHKFVFYCQIQICLYCFFCHLEKFQNSTTTTKNDERETQHSQQEIRNVLFQSELFLVFYELIDIPPVILENWN